ncbi:MULTISPECIES: HI1506-related protein [unclassified Marinimicrobium]|jgi:hypothetical protein|uniref:HI1506-related protein n=1 Tax=unclassified Marinimicrobium TaxID=2632100 RepID=UPI000C3669F6|nr:MULTISPECIES: HI1506-related protein [unclassified Marinimicrobium]MAN51212.1 hypothetical protein [Marinimicrobium sp.]|tara:strand:+ start:51 stop:470 length:420 start_codon:yes stop_codon:yes gene_type:complete
MAARKNNPNAQAKAGTAQAAKTTADAEKKAAQSAEQKPAGSEQAATDKEQQASDQGDTTTIQQVPATDAEQKAAEKAAENGEPTPVLMIRSTRKGGHRRAGMRWTREPIGIEVAALTDAQRKQLERDPNLVVEEAEVDL